MIQYFAATVDPANSLVGYYFTQGVLGITVIVLALVIRFLFSYYTKKIDEKDGIIYGLQNARIDDNRTHTTDYREIARNDQTVLLGNAQANQLLASKIEAVKGKG